MFNVRLNIFCEEMQNITPLLFLQKLTISQIHFGEIR